jgi:pimeloyl-ACP methyl ester carboxylesterase
MSLEQGTNGQPDAKIFDCPRITRVRGVVLILAEGATSSAATRRLKIAPTEYTRPHELVAVDGTRRLILFCLGNGSPVAIFEAGLGGDSLDWRNVKGGVARFTRACSYDRASYGFSDAATRPSDAANAMDDLHRLATAAHIEKPFALVGHSIGGLYAKLYAATYPRDIAGMLLIEPATAGQAHTLAAAFSPAHKATELAAYNKIFSEEQHCLDLARSAQLTKPENRGSDCLDTPPNPDPGLHRELNRQAARPATQAAYLSEWKKCIHNIGRRASRQLRSRSRKGQIRRDARCRADGPQQRP